MWVRCEARKKSQQPFSVKNNNYNTYTTIDDQQNNNNNTIDFEMWKELEKEKQKLVFKICQFLFSPKYKDIFR